MNARAIGELYLGGAKQSFHGIVQGLSMLDHDDRLLPEGQVEVTLLVDLNDVENDLEPSDSGPVAYECTIDETRNPQADSGVAS